MGTRNKGNVELGSRNKDDWDLQTKGTRKRIIKEICNINQGNYELRSLATKRSRNYEHIKKEGT